MKGSSSSGSAKPIASRPPAQVGVYPTGAASALGLLQLGLATLAQSRRIFLLLCQINP